MMTSTVHDVALVFEGGGMRNSYSAGAISVMLEQGLFFDDVYGLSAGATIAIDYVSRDARRNKASFTVCLDDLSFRWWVTPFVDTDIGVSSAALRRCARPLKRALPGFDAFQANPARVTLQAIDRDTGETVLLHARRFSYRAGALERVRASTTIPSCCSDGRRRTRAVRRRHRTGRRHHGAARDGR